MARRSVAKTKPRAIVWLPAGLKVRPAERVKVGSGAVDDTGCGRRQRGNDRQGVVQASHDRLSMRLATLKPARAIAVTTATPVPRETPARSVRRTAPSGVAE